MMKRKGIFCLTSALLLVSFLSLGFKPLRGAQVTAYAFVVEWCSSCVSQVKELSVLLHSNIVTYDITDEKYYKAWQEVCRLLEIDPPRVPVIGLFYDDELKAIIVSEKDEDFWKALLGQLPNLERPMVYSVNKAYTLDDKDKVTLLESLFRGKSVLPEKAPRGRGKSLESVLPLICSAALVDSINPCTFSIFTALLLITLSLSGRKQTFLAGLWFIAGVYSTYYLIGFNLIKVFHYIPVLKYIVSIMGILMGTYNIISFLKRRHSPPLPKGLRRIISRSLDKLYQAKISPLSLMIGILASVTLLPCSSGPYLVALTLMSEQELRPLMPLLLALYNLIFVIPLVIIMLGICLLPRLEYAIKYFRSQRLHLLDLIEGALLIALCIYLLHAT
ncbi:MAG: cytochrome c biogenesis protein CcdA [Thermoprotei archaeon]|nr:cytochrome c biogenesis protein CcdA [Thermoprotei archaeon]